MIYLVIFIALVVLRFLTAKHQRLAEQLYPAILLGLFLFVAFRLEVGCDWNGYYRHFLVQLDLGLSDALSQREPLWWVLVQIIGQLGLGYPWLNVASALIFFAGVHVLARQQPDRLEFLILLFPVLIINMPMSGIRQAAAIGLICMAFAAFNQTRIFTFSLLTLLATGFHSSAAVFLLLAPMVGNGWAKTRFIAALLIAVPGLYLLFSAEGAQLAITRYVNTGVDAQGALYRAGMLGLTATVFLLLLRRGWNNLFPWDHRLVLVGAILMLAVLPLVAVSSVIADRIGYYLVPLQTIIFARIPYLSSGLSGAVLSAAPYFLLLTMLGVWSVYSTHFHYCYLPYENWFFALPDIYQSPN